jgi:hypothetical protein
MMRARPKLARLYTHSFKIRAWSTRGRRFAQLDLGQLNQYWVIAVSSWLARKDPTNELIMDDLASELGLRQLEPPYGAVKHELMQGFVQTNKSQQKKKIRDIVRAIGEFIVTTNATPLNRRGNATPLNRRS